MCDGCIQSGPLLVGETGKPITIWWPGEGNKIAQIFRLGATRRTARITFEGDTFDWTPRKSGAYFARVKLCGDCEFESNEELGYIFYIKLAAPTGGGISDG